ncbi:hypothetical protein AHiyo4_40080 [Arthrobacter sp. Hiyo4]|nr:hypothetical protein AHiyo4_40080 [Arthrobacter sp. Hiyo4]
MVPIWFSIIVGIAALILGYLFCRGSISRVAVLSLFSVALIPLLPGFTEQRQPQIIALILVTGSLLCSAFVTAKERHVSPKLAFVWLTTISTLSFLTVGMIETDIFRLLVGLLTATVMALAIMIGSAASPRELATIRTMLSFLACVAAIIAIAEFVTKRPFYLYTEFQVPGTTYGVFRASAFLGHPLVLCVLLTCVAVLNLSGPAHGSRGGKIFQVLSIALPLAGASASVSRSIYMFVAAGLLGILLARADSDRSKILAFALAAAGAVGSIAMYFGEGFGQRFGELSAQDQRIRLGGFDTVMQITTGHEIVLGAGPKAVAKAFSNNVEGVIYGTVDNQFFTMYAEFGLIGLALMVGMFLALIQGIRSPTLGSWHRSFVLGAIPCAVGFFLMEPVAWPLLSMVFGIGVGAARTSHKIADTRLGTPWPKEAPRNHVQMHA